MNTFFCIITVDWSLFYLVINGLGIFALKGIPEDALPGGRIFNLKGLVLNSPHQYGWTNGTCKLAGRDERIDISKIGCGKWYIGYRDFIGKFPTPFLEPFSVLFQYQECTFISISYDSSRNELNMQYGCHDNTTKDYQFEKCRYYFKFTADLRIKYEISYGCPLKRQLKLVIISNTDYKNFIIVRGCSIQRGLNNTLLQKDHLMILLRRELDKKISEKILNLVKFNRYIKDDIELSFQRLKIYALNKLCDCEKSICHYEEHMCFPMEYLKSWPVFLITHPLTITVLIFMIITFVKFKLEKFIIFICCRSNRVEPM